MFKPTVHTLHKSYIHLSASTNPKVIVLKRRDYKVHFHKRKLPEKSQVFINETLIVKLPKSVAFFNATSHSLFLDTTGKSFFTFVTWFYFSNATKLRNEFRNSSKSNFFTAQNVIDYSHSILLFKMRQQLKTAVEMAVKRTIF